MPMTSMKSGALVVACLLLAGCVKPAAKELHGTVTCGGEAVAAGRVSFVPAENDSKAVYSTHIVDGRYRINLWGGAPLGKYRVEIDAKRKTGRKIQGFNGVETTMVDEEVRMGPEVYAGANSPLVVEIVSDFDGQYDIVLPGS